MENNRYKWIVIAIIVVGIIIAIALGIYLYNKQDISEINIITEKLADVDKKTKEVELNEVLATSLTNMNISPNAIIIEKRYYKTCDHLIREVTNVPDDLVNKTENDVKEKYADWKLEGYSPKEIVLYKEFDGICNEHYVVKEHNGVIGIYTENKEGVQKLQEDTQIQTKYLPSADIENLKIGIKILGRINLNSFLEDYE